MYDVCNYLSGIPSTEKVPKMHKLDSAERIQWLNPCTMVSDVHNNCLD